MVVRGTLGKFTLDNARPRPLEGQKTPLSKKTLLLYVLAYMQQFGSENIPVENDIFVIAFEGYL